MKIKRFFAPDTGSALRMVRDEMGADAVILSNKKVSGGVEVVCTNDYDSVEKQQVKLGSRATVDSAVNQAEKLSAELEKTRKKLNAGANTGRESVEPKGLLSKRQALGEKSAAADKDVVSNFPPKKPKVPASSIAAYAQEPFGSVGMDQAAFEVMRSEIANLKHIIQQQMSSLAWSNFEKEHPQQAMVWQRLKSLGLPDDLCSQLVNKNQFQDTEQGWRQALVKLSQSIPVVSGDLVEKGGIIAFVGPTGSGKTTTIGKLAARYVLKYGPENIALITTDTQRIAAQEQIRTFGRILGVSVSVVDENCNLEKAVSDLGYKRVILVDTPGQPKAIEDLSGALANLSSTGIPVQTVLTLASNSHPRLQQRAFDQYKDSCLSACVLTKLDETPSLGETLGVVVKHHLPIAYVANGQQVPNDIDVVRPGSLVTLIETMARTSATPNEMSSSSRVVGGN